MRDDRPIKHSALPLRICVICALIMACIISFSARAADSAAPISLWQGECRDLPAPSCVIAQELFAQNEAWLATVRISPAKTGGAGDAQLQLVVPAGVHLGSGAFYSVDQGGEHALDYIRCTDDICIAERYLKADEWRAIRAGNTASVLFRPAAGAAPAKLDVSLAGISAAVKALDL